MDIFSKMGRAIESSWLNENYDIDKFPYIAEQVLASTNLADVGMNEICSWVVRDERWVDQVNFTSVFGQPPLTVYKNERFYIEVLFWLTGTTAIHQHGFRGIFYVLGGSSIHTEYQFSPKGRINEFLLLGDVAPVNFELLNKGDCRKIFGGSQFIHSLFHLDYPSISLVVRTYSDSENFIQYSYLYPHIAIYPFNKNQRTKRQLQILKMLKQIQDPSFSNLFQELINQNDVHSSIEVTISLVEENLLNEDELETSLVVFEKKVKGLSDILRPTFLEIKRVNLIRKGRASVLDPNQRFVMALLMNSCKKSQVYNLVREKYPDNDPVDLVLSCIKELNRSEKFNEKFDDFQLDLLESMLKTDSFEKIIESLKLRYTDIDESLEEIRELYDNLRNMWLLQVLFKD